jgi:hypothetical protein
MKLWLAKADKHSWDQYDSVLIAAKTIEAATIILHDLVDEPYHIDDKQVWSIQEFAPYEVQTGVIIASFNAG